MLSNIHHDKPATVPPVWWGGGKTVFPLVMIGAALLGLHINAAPEAAPPERGGSPAQLPMHTFAVPNGFVENRGQWDDPNLRYLLCRDGFQLLATREGPVMHLVHRRGRFQPVRPTVSPPPPGPAPTESPLAEAPPTASPPSPPRDGLDPANQLPSVMDYHAVSWQFPGGRLTHPRGVRPTGALYHSYIGPPALHCADVPVYHEVHYPRVYPGVDLVLHAEPDRVVFSWIVSPGADWRAIRMQCPLAAPPAVHQERFLLIPLAEELFLDQALRAYQPHPGGKRDVAVEFQLFENNEFGFLPRAGHYTWLPLVFTLEMAWSTVFGPGQGRAVLHARSDSNGRILATGWKLGPWLPAARGGGEAAAANCNLFLAAFRRDGSPLWFAEWGGGGIEYVQVLHPACDGGVFLAGATDSRNLYPHPANRRWLSCQGGVWDAFAAAFSPRGHLRWADTLGGSEGDMAAHIEMLSTDTLLLIGPTDSEDFPATEPWEPAHQAQHCNAFAALFSSEGELRRSLLFPSVDAVRVRDFIKLSMPPVASSKPLHTLLFSYDLETGPGLYRDW